MMKFKSPFGPAYPVLPPSTTQKDFTTPIGENHPGTFGFQRKHHKHEGLDFYCPPGTQVYAICPGIVTHVFQFTGDAVGSSWWNDTWAVAVWHQDEGITVVYGEIDSRVDVHAGQHIDTWEPIGKVTTVLKKDKGRPMSMLHLECRKGRITNDNIHIEWVHDSASHAGLINPLKYCKYFMSQPISGIDLVGASDPANINPHQLGDDVLLYADGKFLRLIDVGIHYCCSLCDVGLWTQSVTCKLCKWSHVAVDLTP